ncbi:hypothetical protein C1H46_012305 [Malus baccata]|uniref:Uncharacterized protein n=1 Tax=Malus baccata TaxID=106549 RepID=A0A540MTF0_MALBA|nr:hypothetical protein C1H46_012305 [Malus baccata]
MEVKTKPVEEEEEVVHENEDVEDDGEKDGDKEDDVEEKEEQADGEDENEEEQEMKEKGGTQGIVREEIMKVVGEEALKVVRGIVDWDNPLSECANLFVLAGEPVLDCKRRCQWFLYR